MTEISATTSTPNWQNDLLSSLEMGVVVMDRNFNIEVWNQFMENHSNLLPEKVIGKVLFSFFPEIEEDWFRAKAEPVFSLGSPTFIIWEQRPYLFKFGSNRPITSASDTMYQNVTLFPLADESGEVQRVCMLVYDVTDQALAKIRVETLNKRLEHMSRVDGLTGLFNRRYWQERFDKVYKLAVRRENAVSVLILDIDHFKKVNDTYGHQAGDKVIQSLAQVIKRSIRETDIAGRYGGEEFVVILSDTSAENAVGVAERIRLSAQRKVVWYEGQRIKFTVSLGLAEHSKQCQSAMAWLELADQSLYQAKETGRNQTVVAE